MVGFLSQVLVLGAVRPLKGRPSRDASEPSRLWASRQMALHPRSALCTSPGEMLMALAEAVMCHPWES